MRLANVLLALGLALPACAQQAEVWRGARCIESLQIPPYPVVARGARVSGAVRAQIVVSSGAVSAIEIDGSVNLILRDAVEKSLRASRFSTGCNHSTLEIVFAFVIHGDPVAYQDLGVTTYQWPNQFTISVRPPVSISEIENLDAVPGSHK